MELVTEFVVTQAVSVGVVGVEGEVSVGVAEVEELVVAVLARDGKFWGEGFDYPRLIVS